MKEYIVKIQFPSITEQREVLKLSSDHRALVIYDKFEGQCTPAILQLLDENNIDTVYMFQQIALADYSHLTLV